MRLFALLLVLGLLDHCAANGVECKDIYAHCEENFVQENCEISGWARRNCQKFCNLCPVLGSSDCENAYGDDYCEFHKHLCQDPTDMAEMKEGCAKTCGVCGSSASSVGAGQVPRGLSQCPEQGWKQNEVHEFEYHGRLLTGLPSLASQYSGVGMRATVKVFAKTSDILVLKVQDPKYVDVNHVLYPKERGPATTYKNDGWNWRNLYLPGALKEVPAEYKQILGKPVEFVLSCNGEVREVVVSRDEPEWSINFKKALIVLFQRKVEPYNLELEQNKIVNPAGEKHTTWTVKEDSLQGSCQNTYQVNEMPEYLIKENPDLVPLPRKCAPNPGERQMYFEIIRTRNLHSCERRSQFNFIKPGHINTMANEESSTIVPSRTSVTRSIGCGTVTSIPSTASGLAKTLQASNIVVQRIINENEQNENLMGTNTEQFVTGTKQILILKNIEHSSSGVPVVAQPMKLHDLIYEFDAKRNILQGRSGGYSGVVAKGLKMGRVGNGVNGANGVEGGVLSKIRPMAYLSALYGNQASGTAMDKNEQVKKLLKEVTEEIIRSEKSGVTEDTNKSNINLKLLSAARGFSMYDSPQQIKQLWDEIDRLNSPAHYKEVMRNFFVDTVAMAGTPASIEFIVELIQNDQMTHAQIFNFLMWMPQNIVYPTTPLLERLYYTVRSDKIQRHNATLRNIAVTSFTQLLQQACVSGERKLLYPTFVTGEFCNANSRIVTDEWIPYLLGELASARNSNERNVYIVALGALEHPRIIRELIPYVSGALTTQVGQQVTPLNRLMAIYSLTNIGSVQPNTVIPSLMSVFSNPTEDSEIRIAAFNCILKANPSAAVFERIASVTQEEPDMDYELLKTINIALYTLGNELPNEGLDAAGVELVQKARVTFRLVRRVHGILPTSGTIYTTDFMRKLGVGYEAFISFVASEASVLPKSMYTEVKYILDKVSSAPLRLGYRVAGSEHLYGKLAEILVKGLKGVGSSDSVDISSGGMELSKILQTVRGQYGQAHDAQIDAALLVQLFESGALFLSGEELTPESLAQYMMPYLRNPELLKQKLAGEVDINAQRTFNLAHMAMLIPSDMGLPVNMEYHAPMTLSVIGKMTPTIEASSPKLEVSAKVIYTAHRIAYVGTVLPFTKDLLLTGVNEHTVVNIPGTVQVEMNVPSQKVSVRVRPHPQVTTPVDMLHHHRYPFTVSQKISDLTPVSEQQLMKQIRSASQLKKVKGEFGDYLGLKLTSQLETESRHADLASAFDVLKMYDNNPLNLLVFPWTIPSLSEKMTPSIRQHTFSVMYDPSQSSTKEMGVDIKFGYATKSFGESSAKYHTLKLKSAPGSINAGFNTKCCCGPSCMRRSYNCCVRRSVPQLVQMVSPYTISSKPVGASAVHHQREQKLKAMFDETEVGSQVSGITLQITGILKGSRPRTSTTVLTLLGGVKNETYGSMKQIWDIRLEKPTGSPNSPKHLCSKGTMQIPILPIWSIHELHMKPIDFVFENTIGMGMTSCSDSSITTSGNAKVSEQQKEFSRQSLEAKKCQKEVQQGSLAAKSSPACKATNYQARSLDTIELRNQFTRVPEVVKVWEKSLTILTKAYLLPFTKDVQTKTPGVSANTFTTTLKVEFQKPANAFDLIVIRPQEELVFKNVRIPYPLSLFAPLKAGSNNLDLAVGKIMPFGTSKMECTIERNNIRQFNKHVIRDPLIGINRQHPYTWASLTPTKESSDPDFFGVQVKAENNHNLKVKILVQQSILVLKWESGQPKAELVLSNGIKQDLRIDLPLNQEAVLPGLQRTMLKNVGNKVLFARNDVMDLEFDAETITLRVSTTLKNQLSGICGSSNLSMKGVASTSLSSCRYSKPALEVASSMLQTGAGATLSHSSKQELQKEQEQCQRKSVPFYGI